MDILKENNNNLWCQKPCVERLDREKLNGHRAFILWLTGLPCSGKSTLADELVKVLHKSGQQSFLIDGDNVRQGLNSDLTFSPEDIGESNRRVGEVARLALDNGNIVVVALVSPFEESRRLARAMNKPGDFIEVHCKADKESCRNRDRKGLYERAMRGEIENFIGIDVEYEEPKNPEIVTETDSVNIQSSVQEIMKYLHGHGYL